MRVIQLELFPEMMQEPSERASLALASIQKGPFDDPCKHCGIKDLCDKDDCGQLLFEIDRPSRFKNLSVALEYIRTQYGQ